MKKLMSVLLGMTLVLGAATVTFAQEKKEEKKAEKKKAKKTKEEKK